MTSEPQASSTIFHDLDQYVAMPRLGGLALSPDGTRLVTTVSSITQAGTGYATALWGLDPQGEQSAYRITRSAKGEAGAAFSSTGTLYFTSARPTQTPTRTRPRRPCGRSRPVAVRPAWCCPAPVASARSCAHATPT